MTLKTSPADFQNGLVFGFDVGTGSIGYAVRQGNDFKDVGVLICDSEGSDLSKRRDLRRQRRTLRSRNARRKWFAAELVKLGLPKPEIQPHDPISLRLRALNGEALKPGELHAALAHLFKRRGYSKVPWANVEKAAKENTKPKKDDDDDEGVKVKVEEIRAKLDGKHPCQFLTEEKTRVGKSPTDKWARKIYWPREVLRDEFLAIVKAQEKQFPKLAAGANRLLFGDTREVKGFPVFFNAAGSHNPGVLGMRWPRFDNRGPGLDLITPINEEGFPQHVARKKCDEYQEAQWAMALLNLRVQHPRTRMKFAPPAESLSKLREIWEAQQAMNAKRKKKTPAVSDDGADEDKGLTISEAVLKKWADNYKDQFTLIEGQRALTPRSGAGRARFNRPNLVKLKERIERGEGLPSLQPLLRRDGETNDEALNRFLADIKHPLVRHRLVLFRRLLNELIHGTEAKPGYGQPNMIVVEMARKLGMSENAKRKHKAWQDTNQENNDAARVFWEEQDNHAASKESIKRYKLWIEAGKRCPYCLGDIIKPNDPLVEIEHIVPKSRAVCNEIYNLTLAHQKCNAYKGERTPYEAFHSDPSGWPVSWKEIEEHARACFARVFHFNYQHVQKIGGREVKSSKKETAVNSKTKLDLFLSDNAVELLDGKSELVQTQYLAKLLRQASLLMLDKRDDHWLSADGRDPTDEKGNHPSQRFQVTNGQITSRLRKAWGLNQILHRYPSDGEWEALTEEEQTKKQKEIQEKNRGDLRHHALDAMVIACTLPWLAHRTHGAKDALGRPGYWWLDEKKRSQASNPIFPNEGQMREVVKKEIEKVVVRHHVSRSKHQRTYDTTIYGRPKRNGIPIPDCYVSREPITALKPADLKSPKTGKSKVFPPELGDYLALAWESYCECEPAWEKQIKANKNCLPESFQQRLCFSAFQQWRADEAPPFAWPKDVKIPIKRVGYIGVEDDGAVAPASPGTRGFVARGSFREVRLHPSEDGKSLVPVFVPLWRLDKPIPKAPIKSDSDSVATIRRGQTVEIKTSPGRNTPVGKYRVASTMQQNIKLLPIHLADIKESLKASGFLENGVNISWDTFIKSAGYELPHPPSAQSQPPGQMQA